MEIFLFFYPSYLLPVAEQPLPLTTVPLAGLISFFSSPVSLAEELTGSFFHSHEIPPYQMNPARSEVVTFNR